MPLEIRGAHFLIRSAQLVRKTRLEWALARTNQQYTTRNTPFATANVLQIKPDFKDVSGCLCLERRYNTDRPIRKLDTAASIDSLTVATRMKIPAVNLHLTHYVMKTNSRISCIFAILTVFWLSLSVCPSVTSRCSTELAGSHNVAQQHLDSVVLVCRKS